MQDISDCLSLEAQNVAEARLAAKRAARAEAREIRMKELERQQKEVEERSDKDFGEKDSLAEVEEKYKRSMVTNAQLDNEKTSLQYQVDTLREVLLELEEELAESRRQYDEKHKECERQKHDQNVLRFQLAEMKEALEQRESLLTKHGIALDSVGTPNGDTSVEPHVNADSRPDPPIRATSMGPTEKVVEKKEIMSVVEEIPPFETEQEKQEVMLPTLSDTALNPQIEDRTKENIHESTEKPKDEGNTGSLSVCQTNLEPQGEDLPGLENADNQYEMAVDQSAAENLNKVSLEQNVSDLSEAIVDQRGSSPVESEVFQDALDDVVQSPVITSPLCEVCSDSVADLKDESQNINQQEDKCEVENTSTGCNSETNKETLQISDCRDNASVITKDASDLPTDTKAEHVITSLGGSSPEDSEESSAVESGLQCIEDNSIKTDGDINTPSEKVLVSSEISLHADIHVVDGEKKTDLTPEQSLQVTSLTKEEKQQADRKNNTFEEAVRDREVLEDKISPLDQNANTAESGKLTGDLKSPESENLNTVALDSPDTSMLDKGEQVKCSDDLVCDQSEKDDEKKTLFSEKPGMEVSDKMEQDPVSSHPTCDKETNKSLQDSPNIQLLDEGKPGEISDHPTSEKSENKNDDNNVAETPKATVQSESFSSEGDSSPEGEESDNNNDNDNDMAERSEKYTGESRPLGSSVDNASTDDIRMEDGSDKGSRKGKGKNKEDCVVS